MLIKRIVVLAVALATGSSFAYDWASITVDGVATIPAGTVATVEDADIPAVTALTAIQMGGYNSSIKFLNTQPMTLAASITGGGGGGSGVQWIDTSLSAGVTFDGEVSMDHADVWMKFGDTVFNGIFGDKANYGKIGIASGKTLVFSSTAQLRRNYLLYFDQASGGTVRFGCAVPTIGGVCAQAYFHAVSTVVCDKADVFKDTTGSILYSASKTVAQEAVFDLNGNDQTIGFICGGYADAKADQNHSIVTITSDQPATMTFSQNAIGDNAYNIAEHKGSLRFRGQVSFNHDCISTNVWYNGVSDTTGNLVVSRGCLKLLGNSEWAGSNVAVKAGAALVCGSLRSFTNAKTEVAVEDGGKLVLDAVGCVSCAKVAFGSAGILSTPGTYSVADLAELGYGDYVEGAGSLSVIYTGTFSWPEKGGTAILPENFKLVCGADDRGHLEDVGAFILQTGSSLVISNIAETTVLAGKISGTGALAVYDSSNIVFAADNSARTGTFVVSNSYVTTAHRYGFGSSMSPRITAYKGTQGRFRFSGGGLTNDVSIKIQNGRGFEFDEGANMIVQNGDLVMADCSQGLSLGNVTFNGLFGRDVPGGGSGQFTNNTLVFGDDCDIYLNNYYHTGYTFNPNDAASRLHFGRLGDNGYYGVLRQFKKLRVVCEATNALAAAGMIVVYDQGAVLDLNGYGQTTLTYDFENTDITADNGTRYYSFVTSAVPAVLTVKQSQSDKYDNKRVPCEFCGAAGLTYDGPATYNIVNRYSDTTGLLTVKQGRLVFDWNAGWGGTNVVVTGGTLALAAEAHENVLSRKANVDISGAGRIEIGRDQVRVRTLSVDGGATLKDAGVYGGADAGLDAAHTLECLTGTGTLKVLRNSREPQGVILVVR